MLHSWSLHALNQSAHPVAFFHWFLTIQLIWALAPLIFTISHTMQRARFLKSNHLHWTFEFCQILPALQCFPSLSPIQVGNRSFPLEAVKELKEMMDLEEDVSPRLAETSIVAVCSNPLLPQVFLPVCQGRGAGITFSQLGKTETTRNKQVVNVEIVIGNPMYYGYRHMVVFSDMHCMDQKFC